MNSEDPFISSTLKFVVSNIKNTVHTQLVADNYSLWRSQIIKIFRANGFEKFLDPKTPPPQQTIHQSDGSTVSNTSFNQWILTDQNLAAALCSTISASILPYIINLDTTAAIWSSLETRFQSTNRSKVIQLKNELHNVSLKNQTMSQYLSEIKSVVDQIAAAGSSVDSEDIILYILKGLPPTYQSFKTAIRMMINPISLDDLYPLLLSEEIHVLADTTKEMTLQEPKNAFYSSRGRGRRSRGRNSNFSSTSD